MSSDDQYFLDLLSSIPYDVKRYSTDVAEYVEQHIDHVASVLRETVSHQAWIPSSIRPPPPPPPPSPWSPPVYPQSLYEKAHAWIWRNRAWAGAILAFMGTSGFLIYRNKKLYGRKRRAKKAASGARKEIVVIAGSPHESFVHSIAVDLERRGFIVFITVQTDEENRLVQSEGRSDIRALWIDITSSTPSPADLHPNLEPVKSLLTNPQTPVPGTQPHLCILSGLILVPSPSYPSGPLTTIPPSNMIDTVNTRLLSPVLTTQQFLPLLHTSNTPSPVILMLYPSISAALAPPFSTSETMTTHALHGWASSLRRELHLLSSSEKASTRIDVVELKLGNIDLSPPANETTRKSWNQQLLTGPETPAWQTKPTSEALGLWGSPARELHNAVFDTLALPRTSMFGRQKHRPNIVYVGRGSRAYGIASTILPGGVVGWMLGYRYRGMMSANVEKASKESPEMNESGVWEKVYHPAPDNVWS